MQLNAFHKERNEKVVRLVAQQPRVTTEQAYAQYERIRNQSRSKVPEAGDAVGKQCELNNGYPEALNAHVVDT